MTDQQQSRFWARVDKSGGPHGCWVWRGRKMVNGYGHTQGAYVHRIAYELVHGSIPDGLTIDHLCRNHACVNPAHLEAVSRGENVLRGEGITARNARKTRCIYGHEYTPANTYRYPDGRRQCRVCMVLRQQRKERAR